MTNQSTIDKLIYMRLTSMSDAFITQMSAPKMKTLSFEDRFGLLVDIDYNNRKSNSLKRLIKGADGISNLVVMIVLLPRLSLIASKHDAYKINIIPADFTNYRSMREVYRLEPAMGE